MDLEFDKKLGSVTILFFLLSPKRIFFVKCGWIKDRDYSRNLMSNFFQMKIGGKASNVQWFLSKICTYVLMTEMKHYQKRNYTLTKQKVNLEHKNLSFICFIQIKCWVFCRSSNICNIFVSYSFNSHIRCRFVHGLCDVLFLSMKLHLYRVFVLYK